MHAITIAFHDVVEDQALARAIAPGHTLLYTVDRASLRSHLQAIRRAAGPTAVSRIDGPWASRARPITLTFDDGAVSSSTCVAPELASFGWPAHFFITTDWIGQAGFLNPGQIRELDRCGHVIGTHSCSHPALMSRMDWEHLLHEWIDSCARLSDVLGHAVSVASVPGGYYNRRVAMAAAIAGIKVLFTSEPRTTAVFRDGCLVLGRYTVRRSTPAAFSAALVCGGAGPRIRESAIWLLKKGARAVAGRSYLRIRAALLGEIAAPRRRLA